MNAKQLIKEARNYLLSFPDVTEAILDRHLQDWKDQKPHSLPHLYERMLIHARNRGGMPNFIGKVQPLRKSFCNFHHKRVLKQCGDWRGLLDKIEQSNVPLPSKIVRSNSRNSWVIFSKSAISCAEFLARFDTIDDYNHFVETFYRDALTRLALPLLLEKEIYGYGFALACDFLKGNGCEGFIKPDVHIKDLARGLGITDGKTDCRVFKDVVAYCIQNGLVPCEFDKLLWLIGSGRFYLDNVQVPTSKAEFLRIAKRL